MAAARPDSERTLYEGRDYEFVSPLSTEHQCHICHLGLRRPVLTKCGHKFCNRCLNKPKQRNSAIKCPVDKELLDLHVDIFPDKATERVIQSLQVACLHGDCSWRGELRDMTEHAQKCFARAQYYPMSDSFETPLISRENRDDLESETELWTEECDFCDDRFTVGAKKDHRVKCSRYPVSCFLCGTIIAREQEKEHLDQECPLMVVSCDYKYLGCQVQVERRDLPKHLQNCIKDHLQLSCARLSEVQQRCDVLEQQLAQTQKALVHATSTKFIWRITNFEELYKNAQKGTCSNIKSEIFYSEKYGYKMRLQLYPNGSGPGLTTHVSIFIMLLKGEYDAILDWPFQRRVTFVLYDQQENSNERQNIVSCFIPGGTEKGFRKPTSVVRAGRGYPKFVSHERLWSRKYIDNDSLFIAVEIEGRGR